MANKKKKPAMPPSREIKKDEVMYHLGQMGFIAVLLAFLMIIVTVAKAQGF